MIIAGKCQQQNELKERNRFWVLAAIYDVEAHKMISPSLVRLSALMMEQGDWKRAARYAQEASKRAIFIDSIYELGAMRHTVMNKIRSKEIEQLAALFKGDTNLARNQKNLLHRFDIAFIRLYPDFQKQVNGLLKADCKIETPDNELLNNELRLLALLKLGISDSSRIATILDISVNTVYFYRNRLKNKAVNRDTFEEQVLQIAL